MEKKKNLAIWFIVQLFIGFLPFLIIGCKKDKKESIPSAFFTVNESIASVNDTITFTNTSQLASTYLWDFGDGETSNEENPDHVFNK